MGKEQYGIDPKKLTDYANEINEITVLGVEVAIVIGGGNIYRGIQSEGAGFDRVQGDYMGMLATIIKRATPVPASIPDKIIVLSNFLI